MRLGLFVQEAGRSLEEIVGEVREAADAGFEAVHFGQLTGWDAIGLAALAGREVPGIDVGTAVTQTYPRHPLALAGQALTAQAAAGGRFTLGVGPSHRHMIEDWFGHSYERPARHVREYLTALMPLLRGEQVDFRGETLRASGRVEVPVPRPPSVLLSALGPVMLRIAGELADGTVTVWTNPRSIGEHIAPAITRAAAGAGRPEPRIVAMVLVSVTDDPESARREAAETLGAAGELPAYRPVLERQGLAGVHETVVAGDERAVERAVRAYADAGATELILAPLGDARDRARTLEFLSSLVGSI